MDIGDIGALSPTSMVQWIMDKFEIELLLEIHPYWRCCTLFSIKP